MNLVEKLKQQSDNYHETRQTIIKEIKNHFDEYFNSDLLEKYLEKKIHRTEIEQRKVCLSIEFWEYHIDCSDTYFFCAGKKWIHPEEKGYKSRRYKSIQLNSIQQEICEYLEDRLIEKMKELGFRYLTTACNRNKFEYFDANYYFGW